MRAFSWEKRDFTAHTHLHLLPVAAAPPGLWLRLKNAVSAQALLWVSDGNLWEPALSPIPAWKNLGCWLQISGEAVEFFTFYVISVIPSTLQLVQPFSGCLSDPFQTRKHWGVTSWPSLGRIPTEKLSWGVSRAASSTHMWAPVGFWNFPFVPCGSRKIPGEVGSSLDSPSRLISRLLSLDQPWKSHYSTEPFQNLQHQGVCSGNNAVPSVFGADPSSKAPQGPGLVSQLKFMAVWNVFIQNSCFGAVMKISLEPDCGRMGHKFSGAAWLYGLTLHKRRYFSLAALQLLWDVVFLGLYCSSKAQTQNAFFY